MSVLLRTMMARMAVQPIYEGVITSGDLHIATRDGEAMFFHDSIDFSAYAGTDGGSTPYRFVFTDSAGLTATAYGGAAGGGEALGADIFSGWDFTSGWAANKCTINDSNTFTLIASTGYVYDSDAVVANRLYKATAFEATVSAGSAALRGPASKPIYCSAGRTGYGTPVNTQVNIYNLSGDVGAITDVTALEMKPLTDVPATGLHLMSTKNGTTRNMASVETGFDPNAIVGVKIYG